MRDCAWILIVVIAILAIIAIVWLVMRDYAATTNNGTGTTTSTGGTTPVGAPTVPVSEHEVFVTHPPESPIIVFPGATVPQKADGKFAKSICEYTFDTPSLVEGLPGNLFLTCSNEARKIGGQGMTVASSADLNGSATVWRITIRDGGCWQAPFHAHAVEEFWFVGKGNWTFRWYDPTGPSTDLRGQPISFDGHHPSGPNKEIVLRECGSQIIFKRGTYFEWGSNTPGAQVTVLFPSSLMDGAINEISRIVGDYNAGRIKREDLPAIIAAFEQKYETPFVA